jgi:hypothetical protein
MKNSLVLFALLLVIATSACLPLFPVNAFSLYPDQPLTAKPVTKNEKATKDDREVGRVGKMILGGIAGNLLGIFGGWAWGEAASGRHDSDHIAAGSPFGAVIGSTLGSSLGVFFAGNSKDARGKFGSAVAGSLLGMAAAVAMTMPLIGQESGVGTKVGLVLLVILPPVGSALIFNGSIRSRPLPAGNGILNISDGRIALGIPDIQLRPLHFPARDVKTDWQFNIRVFSVVL